MEAFGLLLLGFKVLFTWKVLALIGLVLLAIGDPDMKAQWGMVTSVFLFLPLMNRARRSNVERRRLAIAQLRKARTTS